MSRSRLADALLSGYMALFLVYLFAPLAVMSLAAFNAYPYPSVTQWRGFTLEWFSALVHDARILQGLLNSFMVAAGVVALSIPLGLAGALVLTRLSSRFSGLIYGALVSPVLTPGIIIAISTLVFWRPLGVGGGLVLAAIAQSTFIASYAMLMFMARLQRQDRSLEEAALDLGASPLFVFRRITLPFLMPSIGAATLIAVLQSIENYNTTVFTIGSEWTLVTEIGARFRFGLTPVINVIGVIFVVITVVTALGWSALKRRRPHAA